MKRSDEHEKYLFVYLLLPLAKYSQANDYSEKGRQQDLRDLDLVECETYLYLLLIFSLISRYTRSISSMSWSTYARVVNGRLSSLLARLLRDGWDRVFLYCNT